VTLSVRPILVAPAKDHVLRTHRRLKRVAGAMWGVGCYEGSGLVGVALVGRPTARVWQKPGWLQVIRVAVEEGNRNACSMLYGACARAARAMGTINLWTYIHEEESGVSLRAAGWVKDPKPTDGGEHSREGRPRNPAVDPKPKWRWWAPWSEYLQEQEGARCEDGGGA